ncbi:site-specific integrase [Cyanobium sp. CH-040]|uniref:tyrosine-type recombinase/integrase n=1 Tax=Cyanobium sp. CH-040 TaxID=2823708 RepID=UPI0020CB7680|nr:site-specific integrase [Cyanobium sp. CH-040]MCP9926391.1 tyrosine-type recombinase/integrase [Cyanobium sp. CH-040]
MKLKVIPTDSQVKALKAGSKRQSVGMGDSLYLIIEPVKVGGGKSFEGRTRFPPGRGGTQVSVRIGCYGKGTGKWTLKEARDEWSRIKNWSKETGRDPRDFKKRDQPSGETRVNQTLEEVAKSYLSESKIKDSTRKDYQNMLWNQIIPEFGAETPINCFAWDYKHSSGKTGRETVLALYKKVSVRAPVQAKKILMVLRAVFDYAIDQGWMERDQNSALKVKIADNMHEVTHHPTLSWDQLPAFFNELEENKPKASCVTICAVKALFLTFLRVGSLVPMRWDELDLENNIWVIPGKRMKNGRDHIVPLTNPFNELLNTLRKFNGEEEFVFASPRSGEKGHMNPYSINQHLIRMGYKSVLRAHGVRSIPLTAGQEVLGFPAQVIQRQMAHVIGDKVRQAYDRSELLPERRQFMERWSEALLEQGLRL